MSLLIVNIELVGPLLVNYPRMNSWASCFADWTCNGFGNKSIAEVTISTGLTSLRSVGTKTITLFGQSLLRLSRAVIQSEIVGSSRSVIVLRATGFVAQPLTIQMSKNFYWKDSMKWYYCQQTHFHLPIKMRSIPARLHKKQLEVCLTPPLIPFCFLFHSNNR